MIEKRNPDWYQLQKNIQGWDEIGPDQKIINLISNKAWSLNLDHCHDNLRNKLQQYHVEKPYTDFYVITDLELSKLPLSMVIKLIKHCYEQSQVGVYVALLSYYLNSRERYNLADTYKENIARVFEQKFSFAANLDDHSCVLEYPINEVRDGQLYDGANFIFVHPNIRYFLWK